jgi:hypothetical protein
MEEAGPVPHVVVEGAEVVEAAGLYISFITITLLDIFLTGVEPSELVERPAAVRARLGRAAPQAETVL